MSSSSRSTSAAASSASPPHNCSGPTASSVRSGSVTPPRRCNGFSRSGQRRQKIRLHAVKIETYDGCPRPSLCVQQKSRQRDSIPALCSNGWLRQGTEKSRSCEPPINADQPSAAQPQPKWKTESSLPVRSPIASLRSILNCRGSPGTEDFNAKAQRRQDAKGKSWHLGPPGLQK